MFVDKLKNWCRGEAVDERHALLVVVSGSPEISKIEDVLQTIKCLGRVRVKGRMLSDTSEDLLVLCECHGAVTDSNVPPKVQPVEGAKSRPRTRATVQAKKKKTMFASLATELRLVKDEKGENSTQVAESRPDPEVVALRKQVQLMRTSDI